MNILLLDSGNTYNYGSMMMAENFIYYSQQNSEEEHNYYVSTNDDIHIERLRDATGMERIYKTDVSEIFKFKPLSVAYALYKVFHLPIHTDMYKKMDRVVFLGGDDFTEIYGMQQLFSFLCFADALKVKGVSIALVGQSVGPFSKSIEKFALHVLRRMDLISLREPDSVKYLEENHFTNITSVTDLALLPLAKEPEVEIEKKYVMFCPSELMYRHGKDMSREFFVEANVKICKTILDCVEGVELYMLPHVWNDTIHGDAHIMMDIYNKIPAEYQDRIILKNESMQPYEVRAVIKKSLFLVAERMHPAISGLECEVPSLVFSYGRKYEGIFGNLYELEDTILDIREFSEGDEIVEEAKRLVNYIVEHNDELRERIKNKNVLARPRALAHIQEIVEK